MAMCFHVRQDALNGLNNILSRISMNIDINNNGIEFLGDSIIDTYLLCVKDSTIDPIKGDVGSFIRESALMGFQHILRLGINKEKNGILMNVILSRCFDNIDRLCSLSGMIFRSVLEYENAILFPHYDELKKCLFQYFL